MTTEKCDVVAMGTMVSLRDTRDGKYYRVKKMIDGRCWMVDNLAFDLDRNNTPAAPEFSPSAVLSPATSTDNRALYAQNTAPAPTIPNNGSPIYPYLYNWCAAMGDTSANCVATRNNLGIQPYVTGICPAPFRLPELFYTNEFASLDIAMGGTGVNRPNGNTRNLWLGTGTASDNWLRTFSSEFLSGALHNQGAQGYWWTSQNASAERAYALMLGSVVPPADCIPKNAGFSVRCIL